MPSLLASTYDTLLNPLLRLFTDTLSSLTAIIKRSLHKYTFHALATYSALSPSQNRWETVMARRGEGRRDTNELRDGLNSVRSVCLRTFPEFLADLKLAATGPGKGGEIGVSLADITVSVSALMVVLATQLDPLTCIRPSSIWIGFQKYRRQLDLRFLRWETATGRWAMVSKSGELQRFQQSN